MNKITRPLTLAFIVFGFGVLSTIAQPPKKAPAYKIVGINVTPFNEASGKFEDELAVNSDRSFFNDLSTSLFVTIDIEGQVGSFESGRMVNITVKEGKKIKLTRRVQVGLIGEAGHYFVPVWLYGSMCEDINITASLSGQKGTSSMKRRVPFICGE